MIRWKNSYHKDKGKPKYHLTKRVHYQLHRNHQIVSDVVLIEFTKKDRPKVLDKVIFTRPTQKGDALQMDVASLVVKVEMVGNDYVDMKLDPPPNNETSKLGEALLQRVQWRRTCIIVKPAAMDNPPRKESTKSPSTAKSDSLLPPMEPAATPTKSDTLLPPKEPAAAPTIVLPPSIQGTYNSSNQ
ncbi:unnamed protein product [Urochloa humidicola]